MRKKWMKGIAFVVALGLFAVLAGFTAPAPVAAATIAAPTSFSVAPKAGTPGAVVLTWAATGTPTSFTIQTADFTTGVHAYTVHGTVRSLTVTGMSAPGTYYFRMRTNSGAAVSPWAPIKTVTTP